MASDAVREMRYEYLMSHSECAYCAVVPKSEYRHCNNERFDVEHIFQRMDSKLDDPCNYVICCRTAHEWKHRMSILGRIAALYWKWKHGELDRERLRELVGLDSIGWVSNRREDGHLPEWADALAAELVKAHDE